MFSREGFRNLQLLVSTACLVGLLVTSSYAQQQRDPRRVARRDTDDLSKFLIESDTRNQYDSMMYRRSNVDLSRLNVQSVRTLLDQFADGVNRLYQQINAEVQYNPQLRSVMSDAIKIRARATLLAQDMRVQQDITRLATSVRELDSDWNQLSYAISGLPQIPRALLTTVASLDRTNKEIEQTFQMEPQINRRELLTEVLAMRADFDNLMNDIELELGTTNEARQLVYNVRGIRQQAEYAADLISEGGDYKRIVEAFRRAQTDWKPVYAQLAKNDSRYIERSVRRIVSAGNELKQLLYLENETNVAELVQTADGMRRHVDEFFKRTPLLLILKLDNPHVAIDAANNFLDSWDVYREEVTTGADQDTLMEVFRDLQTSGATFVTVFRPLPSRAGQVVLSDINRDLSVMREMAQAHYVGDGFDRSETTNSAAEIQTLAEHLDYNLRQWLRNSNDPNASNNLRLSAQFVDNAKRLHIASMNRATREEITNRTQAVWTDWRRLSPILQRAPREDRQYTESLRGKLTSTLVDLMLPLGLYSR